MGKAEQVLARILGAKEGAHQRVPNLHEMASSRYWNEIFNMYKRLGGIQSQCSPRPRKCDMTVDGLGVELDEEQHFNRYRKITLDSVAYNELPRFPRREYAEYCSLHEDVATRKAGHGGWWTNPSCERQFGEASPNGILDGAGAPHWKQRAFHDFVKDLFPLIIGVPVARISVWDTIAVDGECFQVKDILSEECVANKKVKQSLLDLVQNRI